MARPGQRRYVSGGNASDPCDTRCIVNDRRYWFRKKRVGYGLEPGSREGWIATALFVVIDAGGVLVLMPLVTATYPLLLIVWAVFWAGAFLALVFAKGERFW